MIERRPFLDLLTYLILILGAATVAFPLYWLVSGQVSAAAWGAMLVALGIAAVKVLVALGVAFVMVYYRTRMRMIAFWLVFIVLMFPLEARIIPAQGVVLDIGTLSGYTGMTLPLIASATVIMLFRQFFATISDELVEAARLDSAGPLDFLRDIMLPLSVVSAAALLTIQFLYSWNPPLSSHGLADDPALSFMNFHHLILDNANTLSWNLVMAATVLTVIPSVLVVAGLRKWCVRA